MSKDPATVAPEDVPLPERVAEVYKRLAASAGALNEASIEYSKPIAALEAALASLNIGLTTWEKISRGNDDAGGYWSREVGYAKVDGRWGFAIRTVAGHDAMEKDDIELWRFHDAPRSYRIEALDKLPALLEGLITNTEKTAKKLREKTIEARQLAVALEHAALDLPKPKPKTERR